MNLEERELPDTMSLALPYATREGLSLLQKCNTHFVDNLIQCAKISQERSYRLAEFCKRKLPHSFSQQDLSEVYNIITECETSLLLLVPEMMDMNTMTNDASINFTLMVHPEVDMLIHEYQQKIIEIGQKWILYGKERCQALGMHFQFLSSSFLYQSVAFWDNVELLCRKYIQNDSFLSMHMDTSISTLRASIYRYEMIHSIIGFHLSVLMEKCLLLLNADTCSVEAAQFFLCSISPLLEWIQQLHYHVQDMRKKHYVFLQDNEKIMNESNSHDVSHPLFEHNQVIFGQSQIYKPKMISHTDLDFHFFDVCSPNTNRKQSISKLKYRNGHLADDLPITMHFYKPCLTYALFLQCERFLDFSVYQMEDCINAKLSWFLWMRDPESLALMYKGLYFTSRSQNNMPLAVHACLIGLLMGQASESHSMFLDFLVKLTELLFYCNIDYNQMYSEFQKCISKLGDAPMFPKLQDLIQKHKRDMTNSHTDISMDIHGEPILFQLDCNIYHLICTLFYTRKIASHVPTFIFGILGRLKVIEQREVDASTKMFRGKIHLLNHEYGEVVSSLCLLSIYIHGLNQYNNRSSFKEDTEVMDMEDDNHHDENESASLLHIPSNYTKFRSDIFDDICKQRSYPIMHFFDSCQEICRSNIPRLKETSMVCNYAKALHEWNKLLLLKKKTSFMCCFHDSFDDIISDISECSGYFASIGCITQTSALSNVFTNMCIFVAKEYQQMGMMPECLQYTRIAFVQQLRLLRWYTLKVERKEKNHYQGYSLTLKFLVEISFYWIDAMLDLKHANHFYDNATLIIDDMISSTLVPSISKEVLQNDTLLQTFCALTPSTIRNEQKEEGTFREGRCRLFCVEDEKRKKVQWLTDECMHVFKLLSETIVLFCEMYIDNAFQVKHISIAMALLKSAVVKIVDWTPRYIICNSEMKVSINELIELIMSTMRRLTFKSLLCPQSDNELPSRLRKIVPHMQYTSAIKSMQQKDQLSHFVRIYNDSLRMLPFIYTNPYNACDGSIKLEDKSLLVPMESEKIMSLFMLRKKNACNELTKHPFLISAFYDPYLMYPSLFEKSSLESFMNATRMQTCPDIHEFEGKKI